MKIKYIKIKYKNNQFKLGSILLIVILISSGLLIITPSNLNIISANDTATNTEKIDNDFMNGTFNNTEIYITGNNAVLRLNSSISKSNNWIKKKLNVKPIERDSHAMASIWGTDKILLYGGAGNISHLNDTWIYDLSENNWTEMNPLINLGQTHSHAMASIYGTDMVLLLKGTGISAHWNRTWIYDFSNNSWTEKAALPRNDTIGRVVIAPIFGTDKVVLFGSINITENPTWVFDLSNNTWVDKKLKNPPISPIARTDHAMASIYGTQKILLFGGKNTSSPNSYNDTWTYDLVNNTWTQLFTPTFPNARVGHTMVTQYGTDKVLLYGGWDPNSKAVFDDTWLYDHSENSWTNRTSLNNPGQRAFHAMASVYGTTSAILFGGILWNGPSNYQKSNDTWTYDYFLFKKNGTYISSPFDIGLNSSFKTINWNASTPNQTYIEFQLRSARSELGLTSKPFVGIDGTASSYYTRSGSTIWSGHEGDLWVQYKVYLKTNNIMYSPSLKNVTIVYNHWPNTTLISPQNGLVLLYNKPSFEWNFTDSDSLYQSSFQVLIDDDENFQSIDFDSGEQTTNNSTWQFPNQTGYSEIPDGSWYWKVRTKDSDGDWGLYSPSWKVIIDTKAPRSEITFPVNGKFYNNLGSIFGIVNESINGTGIDKVEITIRDLNRNRFWNSDGWTLEKQWLLTNGTKKWSYDSSSIIWSSGTQYHVRSRAIDNATNIEIPSIGIIFTFDMDYVVFSNEIPLVNEVSTTKEVEVGITLSDSISGVNGSTIQYTVSYDKGNTWDTWATVGGLDNQMEINVTFNHTFLNGTNNRIKWRAKDLVGNGPKESIAYPINVNTWQKKIITPKVQLWSPQNGSIIQSNFIELSWMLENWNLPNVTYDIYLDTVDPPVAINRSGLINTTIIVNDLIDGMTYYWTVIPRIGIINGSCLSGVWSFTLDIPIPSVTLISPANGSEVQALRPTFVWTTDYDGTEELTYNIYLGKQEPLDTEILDYDDISHLSKNVLEYNETYYWKVMPKAGGLEGIESETWWFTVRPKDYEPTFGIELLLEPSIIEIKPGETKYVHATVTNVGEINDNIVLSILELPVLGLDIEINEPKMIQVEPSGTAVFNITISAKEDAKEDTKMITVVAASGNAAEHEQVLEKKATLFVKISSLDTHDTGRSTGINEYWILLIIIIVIIIILSFVGLILKKKQEPKGELPPEEASTPEHEPKVEAPQTPENTPEIVTTTSETTPTIDSTEPESKTIDTPMPGQIPQPQIPETTQQPQLPPADIETKDETSGESNEETRQPVEDPSTPPNQE